MVRSSYRSAVRTRLVIILVHNCVQVDQFYGIHLSTTRKHTLSKINACFYIFSHKCENKAKVKRTTAQCLNNGMEIRLYTLSYSELLDDGCLKSEGPLGLALPQNERRKMKK